MCGCALCYAVDNQTCWKLGKKAHNMWHKNITLKLSAGSPLHELYTLWSRVYYSLWNRGFLHGKSHHPDGLSRCGKPNHAAGLPTPRSTVTDAWRCEYVCGHASFYECCRGCQAGWGEEVEGWKTNAFQETWVPYAHLTVVLCLWRSL